MKKDVAARTTRLSADELALADRDFSIEQRRHFFTVRVVRQWNAIPLAVRSSGSINSFKNNYDKLCASRLANQN